MARFSFRPGARLRARAEFVAVQGAGRRVSGRYMTIIGQPNSLNSDRLGIVASRRVGGAVVRNRAKRRLREIFRKQAPAEGGAKSKPMDLVVIARRELADAPFASIEADFSSTLARLRGTRS